MKLLYYTLLLLAIAVGSETYQVKAQPNQIPSLIFNDLADLPYIQEWPAYINDGKYIYSINGYSPGSQNPEALRFDPETEKWQAMISRPIYGLQSAAAYFPANGHAYIFGGLNPHVRAVFAGVEDIDIKAGTATVLKATNPMPVSYSCAATWQNKIYLFGGTLYTHKTTDMMYSFDPQTLKFTKLANMPQSLQTTGTIINGILYTIGGFNDNTKKASDDICTYNITTDTWKSVYKLPQTISANCIAVYGNLIFIIGDYNNEVFLGFYNTANNTFTRVKSNMKPHRAAGAAIIGHMLYIFGGKTNPRQVTGGLKTMQAADISTLLDK